MNIDLGNTIVLLTGATGDIGESIARHLGMHGATVALHYNANSLHAKKLAKEIGNNSKPFKADLSRPAKCVELFNAVVKAYGHVDVLVNNAGIYRASPITKAMDRWLHDWNLTIAVNLTSTGVLCREAIKHFKKNKGGRIINIASRAAFRGDTQDHLAYAASKGGMVALSRSIARAYGKDNIKSFVVAPGFVKTRMVAEYFKTHDVAPILNEIALERMTEPDDVAPTVVFLASGLMDHATGCTIDVNAGSYMR